MLRDGPAVQPVVSAPRLRQAQASPPSLQLTLHLGEGTADVSCLLWVEGLQPSPRLSRRMKMAWSRRDGDAQPEQEELPGHPSVPRAWTTLDGLKCGCS